MTDAYNFALHIFATLPRWLELILIAWAVSGGVAQSVKFFFPLAWPSELRKQATQLIAFLSAFGTALALQWDITGILSGLIAGLWSPIFFYGLMKIVCHFWPWLGDMLSGDVRGVLSGNKRENRE